MLRIQHTIIFILFCSNILGNPITSVRLDKVIESSAIFDGFNSSCQRVAKIQSPSPAAFKHCDLALRTLKKNLQKIHFKSNQNIHTILKRRHQLYTTQHKYKDISSELQKLSDRFQLLSSNVFDQFAEEIKNYHENLDSLTQHSYYSKEKSNQILYHRYSQLIQAVHQLTSNEGIQIVFNDSKDKLSNHFNPFVDSYEMPTGKNLFNYLLKSPNPSSFILLSSLKRTKPNVDTPKIYNKVNDSTKALQQQFKSSLNSGPKKVTVSSWREPKIGKSTKSKSKSKKKRSLVDEFSSIFSNDSTPEQPQIDQNPNPSLRSQYGVVQLPVLLALHPEMQKYDPKSKRFISANPQNFVKDKFYQGFRKKFLRADVDSNSFKQLSQLQALESSRLLDIVNSEKQQKSIYRNIQQTVSKLVLKHNLKGVFYDNLRVSDINTLFLKNKIIVNNNINDLTKETLISLYTNSDQQVLEKVLNSLRKAHLID